MPSDLAIARLVVQGWIPQQGHTVQPGGSWLKGRRPALQLNDEARPICHSYRVARAILASSGTFLSCPLLRVVFLRTMAGLWSNHVLPGLIASGAVDDPDGAEAGTNTIRRLRWLFLVAQFGGLDTQRHCLRIGNEILIEENFFGESESGSSNGNGHESPGEEGP